MAYLFAHWKPHSPASWPASQSCAIWHVVKFSLAALSRKHIYCCIVVVRVDCALCLACKLQTKIGRKIYWSMQRVRKKEKRRREIEKAGKSERGRTILWNFRHNFFGVHGRAWLASLICHTSFSFPHPLPLLFSLLCDPSKRASNTKEKKIKRGSQKPSLLSRLVYVQEFLYCGYTIFFNIDRLPWQLPRAFPTPLTLDGLL